MTWGNGQWRMPQFEGGCRGAKALIAGLASSIDELAAFVNRSLFAMRTCQAKHGDREIRYFMAQQIDGVGNRGLVDGGYFTVGEIVAALRSAENPARHRVPPLRRNPDRHPSVTGSSDHSCCHLSAGQPFADSTPALRSRAASAARTTSRPRFLLQR